MTDQYDKAQKDQYIELGGGYCPECESEAITTTNPRTEDGILTMFKQCTACKAQWNEVFILDDIERIKAGRHADQCNLFAVGT